MNKKIYYPDQIDLERIIYSEMDTSNEISQVYISYDDPILGLRPLLLYLPSLYCCDDVNVKGDNCTIFEILLTLLGKNKEDEQKIISFFRKLDDKFYKDGIEHEKIAKENNAKTWFNDISKAKYKQIIKTSENPDYVYQNGIIKIKGIITNNFQTKFFYKEGKRIIPKKIPKAFSKKCYIKSIIEVVSLGINRNSNVYQAFIRPHQIRISYGAPPVPIFEDYSIIDDSDENHLDNSSVDSDNNIYTNISEYEKNKSYKIFQKDTNEHSEFDNDFK